MKLELIGHDEKYALEQSLLTLFPGEKPVYGTVDKTGDTRWARVTLTEEDERVQVTTELGMDGKSAAHSYDYPLSGTGYEKEGQRRHAVGISFFGAAKDLLTDLQSRNERMFNMTFLVLHTAETRQKLEIAVSQAASVAQTYNCLLTRLDFQHEQPSPGAQPHQDRTEPDHFGPGGVRPLRHPGGVHGRRRHVLRAQRPFQ